MRLLKIILASALLVAVPTVLVQAATGDVAAVEQTAQAVVTGAEHAAEAAAHDVEHAAARAEHSEGLPAAAPRIKVGPLEVTNSMILTWCIALFLIVFAQVATRNIKAVPQGAQNFWEWLVEALYGFLEGIIGPDLVKKTFWFFATVFIFILFTNWRWR